VKQGLFRFPDSPNEANARQICTALLLGFQRTHPGNRGISAGGAGKVVQICSGHRLEQSRSAASEHLAMLREAGLVREERRGRHWVYHLQATGMAEVGS
jgi:DNA-binding transcriptional ArsR family regulator